MSLLVRPGTPTRKTDAERQMYSNPTLARSIEGICWKRNCLAGPHPVTFAPAVHRPSFRSLTMLARFSACVVGACLVMAMPPARAADAADQTPAFTLQIRSLDQILEDVKYLAGLAG